MEAAVRGQSGCSVLTRAALGFFFRLRYKEVQEQRFWQERLGTRDVDELGIDTNASFLADAVQPLPPGLGAPAPAPQRGPKSASAWGWAAPGTKRRAEPAAGACA
jgi:hypothetical protein